VADQVVHLRSLTSLRIFAAALVVAFHVQAWTSAPDGNDGPLRFGYVGVTFFYLLSGFVLMWTWRPEPFRWYFLRRLSRVYPLHWLTAIAAIMLGYLGVGQLPRDSVGDIVWNLTLLQAWSPDPSTAFSVNSVSWSLSNEVFFYAVLPLVAALVTRGPRRWVWLGAASVAFLVVAGVLVWRLAPTWVGVLYYHPVYRVGEFLIGVALGQAMRAGWRVRVPVPAAVVVSAGAYVTLLVVTGPLGVSDLAANLWACNLVVLPAFSLLIAASASRDLRGEDGLLHHSRLATWGQWSFALFLVHELLLRGFQPGDYPTSVLGLPAGIAVAFGALALAGVLFTYVETPLDRALRAWIRQRRAGESHG